MTTLQILLAVTALLLSAAGMISCFNLLRPFRLNVVLVLYLSHLLFQGIAAFGFLLADIGPAATQFFLASALTALLIPVGAMVADMVYPASPSRRFAYFESGLDSRPSIVRSTGVFFFILLVGGGLLFAGYMHYVDSAPLLDLLSGRLEGRETLAARVEASAGGAGYIYGVGLRFFMPALFLSGLIGLTVFSSVFKRAACLLGVGIAFLYCAWATDKTPVAALFLTAFIIMLIRVQETRGRSLLVSRWKGFRADRNRRKRLLTWAGILALLVVAYPALIYMFKPAGAHGLDYVIVSVFKRIGYNPALNSYMAFEAIESGWKHTYFHDIGKLAWLFGWPHISLSTEIALYKGQAAYVNAPPTAVGTFYMQGGWAVLCAGVALAAAIFRMVENLLVRTGAKTIPSLVLYALLLYGAFRFSQANFHTILFTETILPLLLLWVLWQIVRTTLSPSCSQAYYSRLADSGR